jgi:hypothetical protein
LRGRTFPVLKTRAVSGVPTLVLRGTQGGTFAVVREWTDWAEPSAYGRLGSEATVLDGCLLPSMIELARQVKGRAMEDARDKKKVRKAVDIR